MIRWATGYFEEKQVPSPRTSIEWLLAHLLDIRRLDLYLQFDRPLSSTDLDTLRPMIHRRASHEPLQYITGETSFMGCTIRVTPDVLIPREETEQLVDLLLRHTAEYENQPLKVLDLGTGSGCIPIALKKHRPHWEVFAADVSEKALKVARQNANLNQTDITLFRGDLFRQETLTIQAWDLIVTNPPYIPDTDAPTLEKQVRNYEPHLALFHPDPAALADEIFSLCIRTNARLYMECNDQFAALHVSRAASFGLGLMTAKDLDGKTRFLLPAKVFEEAG